MNSNDSIINKIIGDSQIIADTNIATATAKASEIIRLAELKCEDLTKAAQTKLALLASDIVKRRSTVAGIDAKKLILGAKTTAIKSVYDKSITAIAGLSDKEYLKFIENIIIHGAEDNDKVIISKTDGKRITEEFIAKIAKKLKINLTLSKDYGDFAGGVYLVSNNFDKNYTIEAEIGEIEEDMVKDIADKLFGSHN